MVSKRDTVSVTVDAARNAVDEKKIIDNIKMARVEQKKSLDQLAKLTGLTKGYLSKIENANKLPPFSTLVKVAAALKIDVTQLISGDSDGREDIVKISVVRASERQKIEADGILSGYQYEQLAHKKAGKNMEPYIIVPSFSAEAVFSHEGEEFMYVLEGTHEFIYGEEKYILKTGDSIYFDSEVRHGGRSIGPKKAKILAVLYSYRRM
ncbi:MAG TPA: XRE family transcriptional regulator [Syntrophorhabdaceae bacterium]